MNWYERFRHWPSFCFLILSLLCFFRSFSSSSKALFASKSAFDFWLFAWQTTSDFLQKDLERKKCTKLFYRIKYSSPRVAPDILEEDEKLAYQLLGRFFIVDLHIFGADFCTLWAATLNQDLRYAMDAWLWGVKLRAFKRSRSYLGSWETW